MLQIRLTILTVVGFLPSAAIPAQTGTTPAKTTSVNADDRVLNAPYSAQRHLTYIKKLADGRTTRSESGGSAARDSQGRTYSADERQWTYLDNGTSVLKSEMLYRIDDPVSNTETKWDSTSKEVKVIHWPKRAPGGTACNPCDAFLADFPGTVVEKLGIRRIEGIVAEGTRSTYKVSVQSDQRTEELSVVHDRWYSPELKIVVLETNDDPQSGTWKNELVDIVRGEPDATKYRPPADYVINHVRVPVQ